MINIQTDKNLHSEYHQFLLLKLDSDRKLIQPDQMGLSGKDVEYIQRKANNKVDLFELPYFEKNLFVQVIEHADAEKPVLKQKFRKSGSKANTLLKNEKVRGINLSSDTEKELTLAWLEGFLLTDYSFINYKTEKKPSCIENVRIITPEIKKGEVDSLMAMVEGVYIARDLINEPGSVLTAEELSKRITKLGEETGFYTEVFNKAKIKSLKMGGLLAVNLGSIDPPTFTIMEWKPENALNSRPIVLVGKGVVFDTGGLSLKPTANSMDYMKCDMSGAAAVIGSVYAIAKQKLPLHVVGLVPATDNRPGENAYYPGDVIKMYDGSTVEVLNTDAEGRMILADALAYAKKYKPEMVINLATLTGSAMLATGRYGIVSFMKTDGHIKSELKQAGMESFERLVELPLWDEYDDMLKSDVADMKNIGGREAGAITAAKFLERFTDYPFVHFDIAGTAFSHKSDHYIPKGGTGIGVRLLTNFLNKKVKTYE